MFIKFYKMESKYQFQVNLAGIIDILAHHLYTEERVFLRELLQNSMDAISARKHYDSNFIPKVEVELLPMEGDMPAQIVFEDNGIGLNEAEVHQFLANIGASSKKDELARSRQDFIGQFGIGLLSCFMVTREIVMITQSAKGGPALEWRGKDDGSYTLKSLNGEFAVGTKVYIQAAQDKERFFTRNFVQSSLGHYGQLLKSPIYFSHLAQKTKINLPELPWQVVYANPEERREALLKYGEETFGMPFLEVIDLQTQDGQTEGLAFVLAHEPSRNAKMSHCVYLKNMLVSKSIDNILPEWAFFVRCVVNSQNLRPTASRESFYEDKNLEQVRSQLGGVLKKYLQDLAIHKPQQLKRIIAVHLHTMKALAIEAEEGEFFRTIIPFLPFHTSLGMLTLPEFLQVSPKLRYITDRNEYQQILPIAAAQKVAIIEAVYLYDEELISRYTEHYPQYVRIEVSAESFSRQFEDLAEEDPRIMALVQLANQTLANYACLVELKRFKPENIPALYYKDKSAGDLRNLQYTQSFTTPLWQDILGSFDIEDANQYAGANLCLNYAHPLIQRLLMIEQPHLQALYIRLLYFQALLLGHHPLQTYELQGLNQDMLHLLDWGLTISPKNK